MPNAFSKKVKTQFPQPPFRQVKDTPKGKNCYKFFDYWRELSAPLAELAQVKVYRLWPVCDVKLVNPNASNVTIALLEGALPADFVPAAPMPPLEGEPAPKIEVDYEQAMLERHGAGEYMMILNESGVEGEIMRCYFSMTDQLQMERYPPKLDLNTLVRGQFRNEYYITFLRTRNIKLPWENGDEDMNGNGGGSTTADALRVVADANASLANRVAEAAERGAELRVQAAEKEQDVQATAVNKSIELVTETARDMMHMVTSHAGKQWDPVEALKAAKELMAPAGDSPMSDWMKMTDLLLKTVSDSNERVMRLIESHNKTLETILMKRQPDGSYSPEHVTPAPPAQKSFVEQLTELTTAAGLLGFQRPGIVPVPPAAAAPEPREPEPSIGLVIAQNMPAIMGAATTMFMLWANIRHNDAVAKAGQGKPENPQDALRKAAAQHQQNMTDAGAAQPPAATPDPADPLAPWMLFLQQIEEPFIAHFYDANASGYTFAAHIISDGTMLSPTANGRRVYLTVLEKLGVQGFDKLIRRSDKIWPKVQGTPQKYQAFLTEFFNYEQWAAAQQQATEDDDKVAA